MRLQKILASAIISMGGVGLLISVTLGILLYATSDYLDESWESARAGLHRSSETLHDAAETVDSTNTIIGQVSDGIDTTNEALDDVVAGLNTTELATGRVGDSLARVGSSLSNAGDGLPSFGELRELINSLNEAGEGIARASLEMLSLQAALPDLESQADEFSIVLQDTQQELPGARENLDEVSRGLRDVADSLVTVTETVNDLKKSGLPVWILVVVTLYVAIQSISFILVGVSLWHNANRQKS